MASGVYLIHFDPAYSTMPLHIGHADDQQMWKHAVSENRHRTDVSAIEEAQAMATAKSRFQFTDGQIGEIFGYARSTVANKQRLLKLPDGVQRMLLDGQLSERHGRELARLSDYPTEAIEAAKYAISDKVPPDSLERNITRRLEMIEEKRAERAQIAAAQETCKTWCLPGQTTPVGDITIKTNVKIWEVETFGTNSSADLGLLETGMCGKHCECFCIFHKRHANQVKKWQKQYAPTAKLTKRESEQIAMQQRRHQARAEKNATGQQLIDETLSTLNLRSIWNSIEFWKLIAAQNMPEQFSQKMNKAKSLNEVITLYLTWLLDRKGRNWDSEARESVYDVGELRKVFAALRSAIGVSTETPEEVT